MLPLDLDGFVTHVFSTKSKAGNEFFEVKFKIAEATCVTKRIMKQGNQTVTENYLRRLNQEREPVTFKKLSKTPKGDYLFKTFKGSVVQKSASVDFNYNEKHFQKVDFIRAQNLGIFDIMGWIKFLPGKKTIQSPGKTNSLCEAILFDHSSDISSTPTANAIVSDEIEEMPILSGYVVKKYIDNEEEINVKLYPRICPELVGTTLTVDAA